MHETEFRFHEKYTEKYINNQISISELTPCEGGHLRKVVGRPDKAGIAIRADHFRDCHSYPDKVGRTTVTRLQKRNDQLEMEQNG